MNLVYSALLGVVALWALWRASQTLRASGVASAAYGVMVVAAVLQILNLMGILRGTYSVPLSIVTTVVLLVGYAITRRRPSVPEPRG